jgi:hypothetical protein
MSDLAKRAVACKAWRWLPGMLGVDTGGLKWRRVSGSWVGEGHAVRTCRGEMTLVPDLTDPATLGCLLALVREAWGEPTLHVWYSRQLGLWVVSANGQEIGVHETTEAAALVAALEAAP